MSSNAVAALGVGIAALLVAPFVTPSDIVRQLTGTGNSDGTSVLPEVPGAEAFPGAEGFGRRTRGGRGGVIMPVTTLAAALPLRSVRTRIWRTITSCVFLATIRVLPPSPPA